MSYPETVAHKFSLIRENIYNPNNIPDENTNRNLYISLGILGSILFYYVYYKNSLPDALTYEIFIEKSKKLEEFQSMLEDKDAKNIYIKNYVKDCIKDCIKNQSSRLSMINTMEGGHNFYQKYLKYRTKYLKYKKSR